MRDVSLLPGRPSRWGSPAGSKEEGEARRQGGGVRGGALGQESGPLAHMLIEQPLCA